MVTSAALSQSLPAPVDAVDFLDRLEFLRLDAARQLRGDQKAVLGQFFTPAPIARLMASMLAPDAADVAILDAGAGIGMLFAAATAQLCQQRVPPQTIHVTAFEVDPALIPYLQSTVEMCRTLCAHVGIEFSADLRSEDFIEAAVNMLSPTLFSCQPVQKFNCAILNPPYRKIHSQSRARRLLNRVGIETSNLYTGFLDLTVRLLDNGGELVAITPRSFCNGPYFKSFRQSFLSSMALRRLHVFESREDAFSDDHVLQENVIIHAVKSRERTNVQITASYGVDDDMLSVRDTSYDEIIKPKDPQSFIHIVPDELSRQVVARIEQLHHTLDDIGLDVSTGRVVDFRAREFLRQQPEPGTVPLIYPTHFHHGRISWPTNSRKPNALVIADRTKPLLVPNAYYVLVKRFSSKEERRRIVAAIHDPQRVLARDVGFENHLNYFHCGGGGLDPLVAHGLAAYLNSTIVDWYFRLFSGHTQVNASDLRNMKYPALAELRRLGELVASPPRSQAELDDLIETELLQMADAPTGDPVKARNRIDEAREVLKVLGFPRPQQNERSALTLLALLDLAPDTPWSEAGNPLRGITKMMAFFKQHYGKDYAPNTRETVRRQTVHQFLEAALILINPDDPDRPTNSGKTVYQIENMALDLLRTFGTPEWEHKLQSYLASAQTLRDRYAREREMRRLPVEVAPGCVITLSPGGQNTLVQQIIHEFAPRFTPGGRLLYVGDTDEKFAYYDEAGMASLGLVIDVHGKMPDVVIHYPECNWLVLVEAVTTHGPIDPKRRAELERLFASSQAGLVFITAFLNRRAMAAYIDAISWETDVWVADHPTHLVHFDGERFLGPQ